MKRLSTLSIVCLYIGLLFSTPAMQAASFSPLHQHAGGVIGSIKKVGVVMMALCALQSVDGAGPSFLKTWGGSNYDYVKAVKVKPDGKIAFAGYSLSYGDARQGILGEYTSDGTLDWMKKFGDSNNEYMEGIDVNSNGDLFIVGRTRSHGDGSYDLFVTKYNSANHFQWMKS